MRTARMRERNHTGRVASYGRPTGIRVQQRGSNTPPTLPVQPSVVAPHSTTLEDSSLSQKVTLPNSNSILPQNKHTTAVKNHKKEIFIPPVVAKKSIATKKAYQSPVFVATSDIKQSIQKTKRRTLRSTAKKLQSPTEKKLGRSARLLMALERKATAQKHVSGIRFLSAIKKFPRSMRGIVRWKPSFLQVVALVAVLISGYISIDAWLVNRQVERDLQETVASAQAASDSGEAQQAAEGKDETIITEDAMNKYKVAPDMPRIVTIDKINARARVLPMGVNTDGSMQSPRNSFDAGWYTGGVKPGQKGASIIIGHELGPTRGGLFEKLNVLGKGDIVKVERGDGTVLQYRVVTTKVASLDDINMDEFIRPAPGVNEGLNLMSCSGEWVRNKQTRSHRLMVFTERV